MAKQDQTRKIKIQPKYFPRAWKEVVFPEIRLAGKWLQDAGFKCGDFVTITQQDNSITITALPPVEVAPPIRETKRKKSSLFPPEWENVPINQLFRQLPAEEFHAFIDKVYKKKKKPERRRISKERAWEAFKKESRKTTQLNSEQPGNSKTNKPVIQMPSMLNQVADITQNKGFKKSHK